MLLTIIDNGDPDLTAMSKKVGGNERGLEDAMD